MLTVSLHKIKIFALVGMYKEEQILGNHFETDVDITLPDTLPWPFADYTLIQKIVDSVFRQPVSTAPSGGQTVLLETIVQQIHDSLKENFPFAEKIKVAVRKLNPPMPGEVGYAQVCYETP